jgi:putative endonuclease
MYYVYILYSSAFDKYYIGQTDDVERRLLEHNEISEKSYTSKYRPWTLSVIFEVGENRGLALRIEKHLKKQKSKSYLKATIERGNINHLIERFSAVGQSGPDAYRD